MAYAAPSPAPVAARRPVDVIGIIDVCLAAIGLLPALAVFLLGLIPEFNAIWWLGIVLIPLLGIGGAVVIVLGAIGIVVAARRRGRAVFSIVGVVLGALMVLPIALLWLSSITS